MSPRIMYVLWAYVGMGLGEGAVMKKIVSIDGIDWGLTFLHAVK